MNKRIIYTILCLFVASIAWAQLDRTKAPEPTAPKEINISKPYTFVLKNGLKVYVVENHKLPRVAFSLSLDRDPILEKEKAGYIDFAGQLLMTGTKNRTKAELDQEIDFIGASMSTFSTGIFASSLTKHQEKLIELMTDILFNPAFPEEELDKLKKQTLSGLAASKDDPNAMASNVRGVLNYTLDHPYGEFTTEESVENITLEDCKQYYATYFRPNIGYMAIVGDITPKEAKKLVKAYFSKWEQKEVPSFNYDTPTAPEKTFVALVDREASVQSVINVTYPVELTVGSTDVIKARVLNQILGGGFSSRLMQNLREDKAFTYGAGSSLSSDKLIGSFTASASVRNDVTDSALIEFMAELVKIQKEGVTEKELNAAKASIIGSFARSLESPSTVASFAINTALYNLPEAYYANYLKNVSAVTLEDVKAMADKYIKPEHANILVVGKGSDIAAGLQQFGEVKYFDGLGQQYDPNDRIEMPAGVTAQTVITGYLKAIGGVEKLKTVNNMKIVYTASVQGQQMELVSAKNNKASMQQMNMMGMSIMNSVYDGEDVKTVMQGREIPIEDDKKKDLAIEAKIFPELYYGEMDIDFELTGIVLLDGKKAYKMKITMPSGTETVQYFNQESGLLIKTVVGPVITEIKEYKEVEGVMIPAKMMINQGVQIGAELKSAEVNANLTSDTFVIK
ncbi:MAG: zinc protease [Marivirga sp.]|jgi:zinc protease